MPAIGIQVRTIPKEYTVANNAAENMVQQILSQAIKFSTSTPLETDGHCDWRQQAWASKNKITTRQSA